MSLQNLLEVLSSTVLYVKNSGRSKKRELYPKQQCRRNLIISVTSKLKLYFVQCPSLQRFPTECKTFISNGNHRQNLQNSIVQCNHKIHKNIDQALRHRATQNIHHQETPDPTSKMFVENGNFSNVLFSEPSVRQSIHHSRGDNIQPCSGPYPPQSKNLSFQRKPSLHRRCFLF